MPVQGLLEKQATNRLNSPRNGGTSTRNVSIWVLLATNLLVFQLTYCYFQGNQIYDHSHRDSEIGIMTINTQETTKSYSSALNIPIGDAIALPSERVEAKYEIERGMYGGRGDKPHLGGFTEIDMEGISPSLWKYMIQILGVKSLLDVGCGRGISTSWFLLHGVDALCVEGSHDAVERTVLTDPDNTIVEHDFSRGPWWPSKTVDAVWCVEFLEHVGRNFHHNYLPAFRKAALIFATHSRWGGWHHVEVHEAPWWITKFEMNGFIYSEHLSQRVKHEAKMEYTRSVKAPTGDKYNGQHIWTTMMVFINPMVASLPEHAHLLSQDGCFQKMDEFKRIVNKRCGTGRKVDREKESVLPDSFLPVKLVPEMDDEWEHLVFGTLEQKKDRKKKRKAGEMRVVDEKY